jgi:glyoxylase-like metal-dependent hydrolase (beta-lactamase superfamily II)
MQASELMVRNIVVGLFEENCYVIGNRRTGEAICIDPGDEPDEIMHLAADMGVRIKLIANSHGHIDHIMGVRGIKERTDSPFLLHPDDLWWVQEGWQASAAWLGLQREAPPLPDASISNNDVLEVAGVRLSVIHSPGHTQGSVCFYTEGMLFSGDTLFLGSIGRTDLPGGDYPQIMASIVDRLLVMPDETVVLPGHMLQTTIGQERQTNPFILEELQRRKGS